MAEKESPDKERAGSSRGDGDGGGHHDWGGGDGNSPAKEHPDKEGREGGIGGDDPAGALESAANASAAGWGQASYEASESAPGLHDLLGTDGTASDLANKLKETPAGFNADDSTVARTDRDVSEGMASAGIGYMDRARQVGAIDAITQGDATRALSRAVEMGLVLSNPMAAPAIAVGDAVVDGASTGKWGRFGGLAGGVLGARAGLDIASGFANSANGAIAAALGGSALGGAAGAGLGRAIAGGQGVSTMPGDLPAREGDGRPVTIAASSPALPVASSATTPSDSMGHSFYDFIARYGAGAAKG